MTTNSTQLITRTWLAAVIVSALMAIVSPQTALAQEWTTTGNDISNTNTGNVGVGTSTPTYKFDVLSTAAIIGRFGSTASAHTQLLINAPSGFNSNLTLQHAGLGKWFLGNRAANDRFSFINAGGSVEVFSILQNGNVGIGTTTPTNARLHLFSGASGATEYTAGGYPELTLESGQNTDLHFLSPNAGSARIFFGSPAGNTVGAIYYMHNATVANGYMNFTANGERMRIQGNGNIGIGTTSPAYKLDVAGEIRSSTGGFRFPDGSVQTTAATGGGGGGGTITGVTAGPGLTGGGTSGVVTLNVGAGTGISVAADTVSVNYGAIAGTAVQGNTPITITTGGSSGLSGGTSTALGSGPSFTLVNADKGSSQNIFKNVANIDGINQFSAGGVNGNNDTIRFAGAGGTTVAFDAITKKVTFNTSGITSSQWTTSGTNINYAPAGNVGIGVTGTPAERLHVVGNGKITGNLTVDGTINAKYQDVAEWVPSSEQLSAGTVVVLDQTKSNQVTSSTVSYDTRVAGVISEQPGITLGEAGAGKVLVATTGRVRVKVDATRGPIQIGDLLVTGDTPGVAMKSEPIELGGRKMHMPGTLIGKALEPLAKGKGEILVLLSLQ